MMRLDIDEEAQPIYVASLKDIILQKLVWFRLGGGVSERQWRDVQKMLQNLLPPGLVDKIGIVAVLTPYLRGIQLIFSRLCT